MNDSLDNMMANPKMGQQPAEESDELTKIKKKMKQDDQWRRMQLLFAKPLINDLNTYTTGDQSQEENRNGDNAVLMKAYLVEAKPQGLSKIKRFKPYIEKDKEKIEKLDKMDKDESDGDLMKLTGGNTKKTATIPKVDWY